MLIGISLVTLCLLLWNALQLGLIRYFDADEMAYLHWAHNVFVGRVPYVGFLSYVPPGFYYALAPLYWLTHGTDILFFGRVYAFAVFFGMTFSLMYVFWLVRRDWTALISGIFLAFIPIPADKFIEIRPDNLAMLIALGGTLFQVMAFMHPTRRRYWFFSGLLYSVSLLVLPKVLPQVIAAVWVAIAWWIWSGQETRVRSCAAQMFVSGMSVPALAFGVWVFSIAHSLQEIGIIWYSLTKLPLEVNKIGALFPMEPYQFFYPNALLYGAHGWNSILLSNHTIWLVGLCMGAFRLVTPFLPNGKKGVWAELLIGMTFFGYIALFIFGYPMRHEQYLIPIGIFVSFYAADALSVVWMHVKDHGPTVIMFFFGFGALLYMLFHMSGFMGNEKRTFTNASEYETLRVALKAIPENAYVFDLIGSTIYFRDPYYVSAVPFGQWEPFLSRPLPSVVDALTSTRTSHIYEGLLKRVRTLSHGDQSYIFSQFRPREGASGYLFR